MSTPNARPRLDRLPGRDRLRLALRLRPARASRYSIASRVARYVVSPTRMPFTGAADWSRAAVLTTSPATIALALLRPGAERDERLARVDADAELELGLLVERSSRGSASAARTARSGSSSCATGAPKTAITASPMNFSTVPPKRSSSSRRRAWYGRSSAAHVLRIQLLGARREADEVGEEDRDDLALLAHGWLLGRERCPARVAETRAVRILLAAHGALSHGERVRSNR